MSKKRKRREIKMRPDLLIDLADAGAAFEQYECHRQQFGELLAKLYWAISASDWPEGAKQSLCEHIHEWLCANPDPRLKIGGAGEKSRTVI